MFNILLDSCVWLSMAEDRKQKPLLQVLEKMVQQERVRLLVPRVVIDEFKRCRVRVASQSKQSLNAHVSRVREAVNRDSNARRKKATLAHLDDIKHRALFFDGDSETTLSRVEKILSSAGIIEASNSAKIKAMDRALQNLAPCHHENKNSIADAMILETYLECVGTGVRGDRFAFISSNHKDFSLPNGNKNLPHPDIANGFSRVRSLYFINLGDCLRRIDPSLVSTLVREQSWDTEPRNLRDLLKAEDLLFRQVWFNRHMNLRWEIEQGKHKIVTEEEWNENSLNSQEHTVDTVWESAQKAAAKTLQSFGKENFGPWDDFEWGMINGKLSAIRWVLGDEWDMLDT